MRHSRRTDMASTSICVDYYGLKEFGTLVERMTGFHPETAGITACLLNLQFVERTFQSDFTVEAYVRGIFDEMAKLGKSLTQMTIEDFLAASMKLDDERRKLFLQKKAKGLISPPAKKTPTKKTPTKKKVPTKKKAPSKLPGVKKKANPGGKKPKA